MEEHYPFVNTPLPYDYDALEPYIDTLTMHLHHDRHLQAYINNLNAALKDQSKLQELTLEQLIQTAGRLPDSVGIPISRNAGGVYNHRFYFNEMTPTPSQRLNGALAEVNRQHLWKLCCLQEKIYGRRAVGIRFGLCLAGFR